MPAWLPGFKPKLIQNSYRQPFQHVTNRKHTHKTKEMKRQSKGDSYSLETHDTEMAFLPTF